MSDPDAEKRIKDNMERSDEEIADLINSRKTYDEPVRELEEEQTRRKIEKSSWSGDVPDSF